MHAKQSVTKQVLFLLSHTSRSILLCYFRGGVSQTISLGCPQSTILLISASQVAKITGVSHQCLAPIIDEKRKLQRS
jgi:hypothetical protein